MFYVNNVFVMSLEIKILFLTYTIIYGRTCSKMPIAVPDCINIKYTVIFVFNTNNNEQCRI